MSGTDHFDWASRTFSRSRRTRSPSRSNAIGRTLRGPISIPPSRVSLIQESPPSPIVRMSMASTRVARSPTTAPSLFMGGSPSLTHAMSVVVPPISMTTPSRRPDNFKAPTTEAAGPERIVSTGRSSAIVRAHEGAVTAYHHERAADTPLLEYGLHGCDKPGYERDEAGVDSGGGGAPWSVELHGKLMPAYDGLARLLRGDSVGTNLVGGIAYAEVAGDSERVRPHVVLPDGGAQGPPRPAARSPPPARRARPRVEPPALRRGRRLPRPRSRGG